MFATTTLQIPEPVFASQLSHLITAAKSSRCIRDVLATEFLTGRIPFSATLFFSLFCLCCNFCSVSLTVK
jgi:hypothetical protein